MKPTQPTFQTPNRVAIVGEAPGEQEERLDRPFVGASGQALRQILAEVGIPPEGCLITNVFNERPPANQVGHFFLNKKNFDAAIKDWPKTNAPDSPCIPRLGPSQYINPDHVWHLHRLSDELKEFAPNVIIAVGGTALWALTQTTGITKHRGAVALARLPGITGTKVIPTFHTAAMLRDWSLRPIIIADCMKARKESLSPKFTTVERYIHLDPTVADLYAFYSDYIADCPILSCDIETHPPLGLITCIGLAPSANRSLVIPLVDRGNPGYSYWEDPDEEVNALRFLQFVFASSQPYKILGQNFTYDIQYLIKHMIEPTNYCLDTMLHHHALFPEMPKSLGFMGSVYTNEISWKTMRTSHTEKREE